MKTLSIIGCGRVGKTLGRLFHDTQVFTVQGIFNQTPAKTAESIAFIGAGTPITQITTCPRSDVMLIGVVDGSIAEIAALLAQNPNVHDCVVLHCSGLLTSELLKPLNDKGCSVASVHPFNSFADPALSIHAFTGTPCAIEGDPDATGLLSDAFARIQGKVFAINKEQKPLYHATAAMVSNHLVALLDVGLAMYTQAGFTKEQGAQLMEPIVRTTVNNIFTLGTTAALTGAVVRGDVATVKQHIEALAPMDPAVTDLYKSLAHWLLPMATERKIASSAAISSLDQLLKD